MQDMNPMNNSGMQGASGPIVPDQPLSGQPAQPGAAQSMQPQPSQPQTQASATQTVPPGTGQPVHATAGQPMPAQPSYGAQPSGQPVGALPQHAPHKEKSSGGSGMKTFLLAFAGAALACIIAFAVVSLMPTRAATGDLTSQNTSDLGASQTTDINTSEGDASLATAVASKCLPSVAAVDVYARSSNGFSGIYGFGFGPDASEELSATSLGSGVVLSDDGYVVTNYHVVSGGERFEVTVDGETYEADLVGSDPSSDLAVLKCQNATGLEAMEIGNSDDLVIGEWVMSIGSPFGLEQSVATGIVSATSRSQIMNSAETGSEVTIYPNMIQTDAAINPGNSGGALVDANGQLVGINTLITSYSGNYSGVGFAIPVNYAINIAQQIIDGQAPTHAQLGVSLVTINAQMAARYGLSVNEGAYVSSVSAGSGAEAAGIEEGDIITSFDGEPVASASDLMLDVRTKNPGDTVTLTVVTEDGQSHEVQVVLGSDASTAQQQR